MKPPGAVPSPMTESDRSDGELVCDACGKSFDSEEALEEHVHEVGLVE